MKNKYYYFPRGWGIGFSYLSLAALAFAVLCIIAGMKTPVLLVFGIVILLHAMLLVCWTVFCFISNISVDRDKFELSIFSLKKRKTYCQVQSIKVKTLLNTSFLIEFTTKSSDQPEIWHFDRYRKRVLTSKSLANLKSLFEDLEHVGNYTKTQTEFTDLKNENISAKQLYAEIEREHEGVLYGSTFGICSLIVAALGLIVYIIREIFSNPVSANYSISISKTLSITSSLLSLLSVAFGIRSILAFIKKAKIGGNKPIATLIMGCIGILFSLFLFFFALSAL